MKVTGQKVVTIITETLIEKKLISELKKIGIGGYTVEDVRGEGKKGFRDNEWDQSGNVRIQVVCDKDLAEKICNFISRDYFEKYAMFVFMFDADMISK